MQSIRRKNRNEGFVLYRLVFVCFGVALCTACGQSSSQSLGRGMAPVSASKWFPDTAMREGAHTVDAGDEARLRDLVRYGLNVNGKGAEGGILHICALQQVCQGARSAMRFASPVGFGIKPAGPRKIA